MTLQFRYQRAKMYRKVALGLKHHMSVSHGKQACMYVYLLTSVFPCFLESKLAIKNLLVGLIGVYVSGNAYNSC